jgi:hypothetical protein
MVANEEVGGGGSDIFKVLFRFRIKILSKTTNPSDMTADSPAEIQTGTSRNAGPKRYRCASLQDRRRTKMYVLSLMWQEHNQVTGNILAYYKE